MTKKSINAAGLWPAAVFCLLLTASNATAQVIYDSIPDPLPGNVPSLGYQANQTAEFGDLIAFAGANRTLTTVTVVMSDWARKSDFNSPGTGFNHPLTLNLYNVDNSGPNPAPGTLIASKTQTFSFRSGRRTIRRALLQERFAPATGSAILGWPSRLRSTFKGPLCRTRLFMAWRTTRPTGVTIPSEYPGLGNH